MLKYFYQFNRIALIILISGIIILVTYYIISRYDKSERKIINQHDIQNDIKWQKCEYAPIIDKNDYVIFGNCLYSGGKLVFEKNLILLAIENGFYDRMDGKRGGDEITEWFRMESEDNMRLFLRGMGGCGGCIFSGLYLEIDKNVNKVELEFADLPYIGNTINSPDNQRAVYLNVPHFHKGQIELRLYDYSNLKDKGVVYIVSDDESLQTCGDGCYIYKEAVKWLDNENIAVHAMKRGQDDFVYEDKIEFNEDPIVINIESLANLK